MMSARRPSERDRPPRREVLFEDLDRFDNTRALYRADATDWALCDAVRSAVAGALTPRQRDVVEAYFFEGLSQGAIARRMGVAQQVVQKALFGDLRGGRRVGGALSRLKKVLSAFAAAPAAPRNGY